MIWNDLYIAGLGTYLPPTVHTDDMVREGVLTAQRRESLGYHSVLVETEKAAPDMAALAGSRAVAQSGIPVEEFGLVVHGSLWFQGRPMWPAASYVASRALGDAVPALDMGQQCNAGLGSLELAASHLAAGTRGSAVLLTTGDRFAPPAIDRWNTHDASVYADAGTAMVLSRNGGYARVLATTTTSDNFFEGMNRGTGPLDACPPSPERPISMAARKAEFGEANPGTETFTRLLTAIATARQSVLDQLGMKIGDMKKVIDVASRGGLGDEQYCQFFGIAPEQSTWDFGSRTGHLGAGDHFAGLADLLRTGQVGPGDLVMLFGGGGGYTCTAAVVEILQTPTW
ncbi:ketoacyl-ACP synthase III family protein [Streptomyces caatingaensis]|uniref:3-oxoacyl-ACP synthase n=1 Tax=Streptomyces caatingaensis TaxID=1678637 RepID=A0A0K9XCR8_9ACTN|nr:ketoacyl-ACP synthase III family protein [Streptomyces caatingaensis]KNB50936.1 hypothetical protein AC230_19345 [Streptomyces caatingaensis]